MQITISYDEVRACYEVEALDLPKYAAAILNNANQVAQATRPKGVGQMTDLIQEFPGSTLDEWRQWYLERHPETIETATNRIMAVLEKMQDAMASIDEQMVKKWVDDLVIVKTFLGLRFQAAILKKIAELCDTSYRLAEPEEEARGIDGFVGHVPFSIKPESYQTMGRLPEDIEAQVVYYEKTNKGITFTFDETAIGLTP